MNILKVFIIVPVITCSFFIQACATEHVPEFKKVTLTTTFISEGVCVGDVNHDGQKDVMAGAFWFEAPNWKKHVISNDDIRYDKSLNAFPKDHVFKVEEGYSNSFLNFTLNSNIDKIDLDYLNLTFFNKEKLQFSNQDYNSSHI